MEPIPQGDGNHPISLVVIATGDGAASTAFYSRAFGWPSQPMGGDLTTLTPPGGPLVAIRGNAKAGDPPIVPYLLAQSVEAQLEAATAAGGEVERAPWNLPFIGDLARFTAPGGAVYGLASFAPPNGTPSVPAPFGAAPRPADGALCSIEMYAADREAAAAFFQAVFGWGCQETMPSYTAFDPGAGIGGVFQSHTPDTCAMPYIYTSDVKRKLSEIAEAGGTPIGDPMGIPNMATFGYFTDAAGISLGLIGPIA